MTTETTLTPVHYYGVVRFETGGWVILNNATHTPSGLASVRPIETGELEIVYTTPLVTVGTANVTMDEAYAGKVFAGNTTCTGSPAINRTESPMGQTLDPDDGPLIVDALNAQQGTTEPGMAKQLDRINRVLINAGFSYPLGAAGVEDLGGMRIGVLEDLEAAEARIALLERQRDAVLALCDQADASKNSAHWNAPSGDAIRAIYADTVPPIAGQTGEPASNKTRTGVNSPNAHRYPCAANLPNLFAHDPHQHHCNRDADLTGRTAEHRCDCGVTWIERDATFLAQLPRLAGRVLPPEGVPSAEAIVVFAQTGQLLANIDMGTIAADSLSDETTMPVTPSSANVETIRRRTPGGCEDQEMS